MLLIFFQPLISLGFSFFNIYNIVRSPSQLTEWYLVTHDPCDKCTTVTIMIPTLFKISLRKKPAHYPLCLTKGWQRVITTLHISCVVVSSRTSKWLVTHNNGALPFQWHCIRMIIIQHTKLKTHEPLACSGNPSES